MSDKNGNPGFKMSILAKNGKIVDFKLGFRFQLNCMREIVKNRASLQVKTYTYQY